MAKRILIVGAGKNQMQMIVKARELGCYTIAADGSASAPGFPLADLSETCNITSAAAVTEAARKHSVDAIYPAAEPGVEAVAAAAAALGLPGVPVEVAERVRNKRAMRQALSANGVPCPKFRGVKSLQEARDAVAEFGFPVIVKPADGSASKGVKRVDTDLELPTAFNDAVSRTRLKEVLIESFMEGEEFGIDGLVYRGEYIFGGITHKIRSAPPNRFDMGLFMPPKIPDEDVDAIIQTASKGLAAVGFTDGTTHCEVILSEDGPRIVEMAGRPGGARIPTDLIPLAYGMDFIADSLRIAMGESPREQKKFVHGSAIWWLSAAPGVVLSVEGVEAARAMPGVRDLRVNVHPEDVIEPTIDCVTRDSIGYVLVEGSNVDETIANANRAANAIRITTRAIEDDETALSMAGDGSADLESVVSRVKEDLARKGYALLKREERPAGISARAFIERFGALMPQYNGEMVYSIKAAHGYESLSDSKGSLEIPPHTDGSMMEVPPRLLALAGVQEAQCGGGDTLLADAYAFIEELDPELQEVIKNRPYAFGFEKGVHASRGCNLSAPIESRQENSDAPVIRFSYNLLWYGDYSPAPGAQADPDESTREICARALQFFDDHKLSVRIGTGDLLIWDNWRMLHSRTAFKDLGRHLRRYWLMT